MTYLQGGFIHGEFLRPICGPIWGLIHGELFGLFVGLSGFLSFFGGVYLRGSLSVGEGELSKIDYFTDKSVRCRSVKYRTVCKIQTRSCDVTKFTE